MRRSLTKSSGYRIIPQLSSRQSAIVKRKRIGWRICRKCDTGKKKSSKRFEFKIWQARAVQTGEGRNMKSSGLENRHGFISAEKISAVLLKLSSEFIRVYLWFLKFSNYLLRLVQ